MRGLVLLLALVCLSDSVSHKPAADVSVHAAEVPRSMYVMQATEQLRGSVGVLEYLLRTPVNAVPNALLERTQCVLVALAPAAWGVVTCRRNSDPESWGAPVFTKLSPGSGLEESDAKSAWLFFILPGQTAGALQSGVTNPQPIQSSPGHLEWQIPATTGVDLSSEIVSYRLTNGALSGAQFHPAALSVDQPANQGFYEHEIELRAGLASDPASTNGGQQFLSSVTSYFNTIIPRGIIIHHSADHWLPTNVAEIDREHEQRGFGALCFGHEYHVGYHYLIFPDGRVVPGRPERCVGAHARGYNMYLGISLIGDFSSTDGRFSMRPKPTPQQLHSLVVLIRQLQARYDIPVDRILRHRDVSQTDCPGDRLPFDHILAEAQHSPIAASAPICHPDQGCRQR